MNKLFFSGLYNSTFKTNEYLELELMVGFFRRFEITSKRESGFGRYDVIPVLLNRERNA
jgi:hypothetical protein